MADAQYDHEIEKWRSAQDDEIRRAGGLLSLIGLFWLQPGMTTVGSSPDCAICLPKPIPRLLGAFERAGGGVTFHVDIGQTVDVDGVLVATQAPLRFDDPGARSVVRSGGLAMALVRHVDRAGVQVWREPALEILATPERIWFPVDPRYRIRAAYTPYPAPARITLPNSLGEVESGYVQGYVTFKLGGRSHNLDAAETDDARLLLHFKDSTSGILTYPDGRYLLSESVAEDGVVYVDFNRACSPASAFSRFAICTLAPGANHLAVPISAGERYRVPKSNQQ